MKSEFLKALLIFSLILVFAAIVFMIVRWQIIKIQAQETPGVIITEIMYDLEGSDSNREWIEIYNRGSQAVEIIGGSGANSWRFNDGSNHILTLIQGDLILEPQEVAIITSDAATFLSEHANFSGTVIDTVMSLNNSGDLVALSQDNGQTFFSQVNYQSSWGANGNGKTLEKISLYGDDSQSNWQESTATSGTPGLISQSIPEPPVNNPPIAEAGENQTVQVNQLVTFNGSGSADPDGNPLTYNWDFGDGASSQGVTVSHSYSASGNFIVILEVSDGQLSATDTLQIIVEESPAAPIIPEPTLEPEQEPLINHAPIAEAGEDKQVTINETVNFDATNSYDQDDDLLTYFWDFGDGSTASGATTTHQYVQAENYSVTLTVSDGQAEDQVIILVEVRENLPVSGPSAGSGSSGISQPSYSDKIIINEILPNPKGSDKEVEFIELFNQGYETVDLNGFKLQDNSSRVYTIEEGSFSSTEISAGGYFVITRKISGISLNNSGGDKVILYQSNGNQLQVIEYSSSAQEGKAYARKNNGEWAWTINLTPGTENSFAQNQPPEAKFIASGSSFYLDESVDFDGSSSIDSDGDKISYHWDFGDGQVGDEAKENHTFETIGAYNVILTVTDQQGLSDATTKQIKIKNKSLEIKNINSNSKAITSNIVVDLEYINNIVINEFLPNPINSDESEWIELYNNSSEKVDLSNIMLDDADGGSEPFLLKGFTIEPFSYLIVNRSASKIALNNSADSVRLLAPDGQIIQIVDYIGAKEGESYSYNQLFNNWFWSKEPTLGAENSLPAFGSLQLAGLFNTEPTEKDYQLSEISELDKGTLVSTHGIVTVPPGILGKQFFYLAEVDLSNKNVYFTSGLEIYSSRAEFPELKVGDVVEFSGKVSETKTRKRINLQKDSRLSVVDHWELPAPDNISTAELSNDLVGSLVSVSGNLLEQKGISYYLDDGSGEIKVYLKKTTNIPKPEIEPGFLMSAVGIVDLTETGLRLLPRFPDDINVSKVLGEKELANDVMNVKSDEQGKRVMKYLFWGGGGILIVLLALVIKYKLLR